MKFSNKTKTVLLTIAAALAVETVAVCLLCGLGIVSIGWGKMTKNSGVNVSATDATDSGRHIRGSENISEENTLNGEASESTTETSSGKNNASSVNGENTSSDKGPSTTKKSTKSSQSAFPKLPTSAGTGDNDGSFDIEWTDFF